jgi:signal transduction histidine kinase
MAPILRKGRLLGVPPMDVVLAVVLLVAAVGGLLTREIHETPWTVTVPVAVVTSLSLLGRTRWPLVAAVVTAVANVAQAVWADQPPGSVVSLVVILLLAYGVGVECEEALAACGLAVLLLSSYFTDWREGGSDYVFITVLLGGSWLLGRAVRTWRTRATTAEQHQRDVAKLAVAEERTRIARELHDVVAHGLSVIAVQADAAEAALERDPALAGEPLRAIRTSARDALSDMRQLLEVLRTEGSDERAPARGLADLPRLVEGMRASGLPLEAEIRVAEDVPAGLSLTIFRIPQEGLTNVRTHAGAVPTHLEVVGEAGEVRVRVANEAGAPLPAEQGGGLRGHGLIGVRERVRAAGGTVTAGPTAAGGFEIDVVLPLGGSS